MKRSRAIILFGSLTLSILVYVAWCGRSFYLPKKLKFLSDGCPSEVRSQFEDWHGQTHIDLTAEFRWDKFLLNLRKPSRDQGRTIEVQRSPVPYSHSGDNAMPKNTWYLLTDESRRLFQVTVSEHEDGRYSGWAESYSLYNAYVPYPERLQIKLPLHGSEGEALPEDTPESIWEMVQSSGQDEP